MEEKIVLTDDEGNPVSLRPVRRYDQEGSCHFRHFGNRHLRRSGQDQVRCTQQQAGNAGRLLHQDRPGSGCRHLTREERVKYESENCGT